MAELSTVPDPLALELASAMRWARLRRRSMRAFANELRQGMGWKSLSHASIYAWEAGTTRIPAAALVAAARMEGLGVDELLQRSRSGNGTRA